MTSSNGFGFGFIVIVLLDVSLCPKSFLFLSLGTEIEPKESVLSRDEGLQRQPGLCSPDSVYCVETGKCLDPLCVEDTLRQLDVCPLGSRYCPATDECLPVCSTKQLLTTDRNAEGHPRDVNVSESQRNGGKFEGEEGGDAPGSGQFDSVSPTSGRFSNSLDSIEITFDSMLSPQTELSCLEIFTDESTSTLGQGPMCTILAYEVIVSLGFGASISFGSKLDFQENSPLQAFVAPTESAALLQLPTEERPGNIGTRALRLVPVKGSITARTPQNPSEPCFVLFGPRQVCQKTFTLKPIGLCGNGQNRLKYIWEVIFYSQNSSINGQEVAASLQSALESNQREDGSVTLSSDNLSSDGKYIINIFAENRFGLRSRHATIHSLQRVTGKAFVANIMGQTMVDPNAENSFTAAVAYCESHNQSDGGDGTFEYIWSIRPPDLKIPAYSSRKLTIAPRKLVGGKSYLIAVEAKHSAKGTIGTFSMNLITMASNLVGVVNSNGLVTGLNQPILLDAGASFDPNNEPSNMSFHWNCNLVADNSKCFEGQSEAITMNKPLLNISEGMLSFLGEYRFGLTVKKGNRLASMSVPMMLTNQSVPLVITRFGQKSELKVNTQKPLVVKGYVSSKYNVTVKWESISEGDSEDYVNLDDLVNLDNRPSRFARTYAQPNNTEFSLVIPGRGYLPEWKGLQGDARYRFSLSAESADGKAVALSDIVVSTNSPPSGRLLWVRPLKGGIALSTKFIIDASQGWNDVASDCPLSYDFYYSYPNECSPTYLTSLRGLPPTVEAFLPGSCCQPIEIIVVVRVCDKLNACSLKLSSVEVLPSRGLTMARLYQLTNQTMQRLDEGQTAEAIALARAVMQTVNSYPDDSDLVVKSAQVFQEVIDQIALNLMADYESDYHNSETARQLVNLMHSLGVTLSPHLVRRSTISNMLKLRSVCLKSIDTPYSLPSDSRRNKREVTLETLWPVPLGDAETYAFLLIDELQLKRDPSLDVFHQFLRNSDFYLRCLCLELKASPLSVELESEIILMRVERKDLDGPEVATQMVTIASRARQQIGGFVTLGSSLSRNYSNWECGFSRFDQQTSRCAGVCLASAEISMSYAVLAEKTLQSPMVQINAYNPRNSRKLEIHNLEDPITFTLPLDSATEIGTVQCAKFIPRDNEWQTSGCKTQTAATWYLICACNGLGYFGAISAQPTDDSPQVTSPTAVPTASPEMSQPKSVKSDSITRSISVSTGSTVDSETTGTIEQDNNNTGTTPISTSGAEITDSGAGSLPNGKVTDVSVKSDANTQSIPALTGSTVDSETIATEEVDTDVTSMTTTGVTMITTPTDKGKVPPEVPEKVVTTMEPSNISSGTIFDKWTTPMPLSESIGTTSMSRSLTQTPILVIKDNLKEINSTQMVLISIRIKANYDDLIGDNPLKQTQHLKVYLAKVLGVSAARLYDLKLIRGSVFVEFNLVIGWSSKSGCDPQKLEYKIPIEMMKKAKYLTGLTGMEYPVESLNVSDIVENEEATCTKSEGVETLGSLTTQSTSPSMTSAPSAKPTPRVTSVSGLTTLNVPKGSSAAPQSTLSQSLAAGKETTSQVDSNQKITPKQETTKSIKTTGTSESSATRLSGETTAMTSPLNTTSYSIKLTTAPTIIQTATQTQAIKMSTAPGPGLSASATTATSPQTTTSSKSNDNPKEKMSNATTNRGESTTPTILKTSPIKDKGMSSSSESLSTDATTAAQPETTAQVTAAAGKNTSSSAASFASSYLSSSSDLKTTKVGSTQGDSLSTNMMTLKTTESSTKSSETTKSAQIGNEMGVKPITLSFVIQADFKATVGNNEGQFLVHLRQEIAAKMGVPLESVQSLQVKTGSILVDFQLKPSQGEDAAGLMKRKETFYKTVNEGKMMLKAADGKPMKVVTTDEYRKAQGRPREGRESSSDEKVAQTPTRDNTMILIVSISVVIAMILMMIVTALTVKAYMRRKYERQVLPMTKRDIDSYLKRYSTVSMIGPLYDLSPKDIRDGAKSVGQFSYDSGIWVGPGPEPQFLEAAEPVEYLPPSDRDMSQTPRPSTGVRHSLKSKWNLDMEKLMALRELPETRTEKPANKVNIMPEVASDSL